MIIFVGGTCGSVHVQTFYSNLKELVVVESKRNAIRRGFVHELLNAQDTVLCSYFAQRAGTRKITIAVKRARWKKSSKDWRDLNENWWKVVGRNTDREAEDYVHVDSCRRHYTHCSCSGWRKRRSGLGGNQHRYDPLLAVGDGHPQMQRHLCG